MRILLISPLYYPSQSPNVYRWDAIAKYWLSQGHEVHWLCSKLSGEPDEAKINGIFIHRAGHNTLLDWWYNVRGSKKGRRGVEGSGLPQNGVVRHAIERIVSLTWRNVYWPDGTCIWFFPARKKALQLLGALSFDAIISVSLPFTAVLIASSVKKRLPKLKWLMDIEDPFSFVEAYSIFNRMLFKKLSAKIEAQALQLSDVISVTVEAAKNEYTAHFPQIIGKIFVVPPLFENKQGNDIIDIRLDLDSGSTHIGYFGTFYYPIRSPEGFLELLRLIKSDHPAFASKLKVHFVGTIPHEYTKLFENYEDLSEMIVFYGLLSREKVAAMIRQVHFLVNIGNTTTYHLPSKSAEYLMSGKPLINIAASNDDSFSDFMDFHPQILNLFIERHQPTQDDVGKLMSFIEANKGKQIKANLLEIWGKNFSVEAVANRYMGLIKNEIRK